MTTSNMDSNTEAFIQKVTSIEMSLVTLTDLTQVLVKVQTGQIQAARRWVKYLTAGFVTTLLLFVFCGFLTYRSYDTSNRITKQTDRISMIQNKTSVQALCPLYDVFLDLYNPKGPSAKLDPVGYEETFATLEKGAVALGCPHVTKGRN